MPKPSQPLPAAPLGERIAARQQALARNPNDVPALAALAGLFAQARQWGRAAQAYSRALALEPGHREAREGAARVARAIEAAGAAQAKKGETGKAIEAYQRAVSLDPACPLETYLKLGALLDRADQTERAMEVWRQGSERYPHSAAPHVQIGGALRKLRRADEAAGAFRRGIQADPRAVQPYRLLADLCAQEGGRLEEALALCKKIHELMPGDPDAAANEANVLELMGKPREAHERILPLIRAGHRTPHLVQAFGKVCQRIDPPSEEALPLLRDELVRPGLTVAARAKLLRTIAGLCDALGQVDEAFSSLEQAKHIEAGQFEDSKEELLGVIDRSRTHFTRERLARLPRAGQDSELPIFIVGMPRSGTSLAEQILASHPQVFGAGELTTVIALARTALGTGLGYPECFESWTQQRVDGAAAQYLRQLRELSPDAARVTDKMPFNFLHLGMIASLFPRAKIVHCLRNPLDTCISCYFLEFSPKLSIFSDLTTLGRYYRGYRRLMRHWRQELPVPVFELQYEQLLADPERTVRDLVAFCGLEWNDACLKFHETKRQVRTFSYHQVRKPLYTQSVGRARAYERYLGPLVEAIGDELDPAERLPAPQVAGR